MATLFAWSGALKKRGELDGNAVLVDFADTLEAASIKTINEGVMTKELAVLSDLENIKVVNTENFLREIGKRLDTMLD